MGFFSNLVSSDDEKEVQLLTAFYYVLGSCAVMKALDEQKAEKAGISTGESKPLNTRGAVAELGIFKTITSGTEQKISKKTIDDIMSGNFDISSDIKTQMEIITNSDLNAAKGLATILNGFIDIANDGYHESFKTVFDYIVTLLPAVD